MKIRSLAVAGLFLPPALVFGADTNNVVPDDNSATNPVVTLPEITVTGTRIATPQEQSPESTTVITREQIEQSQQHSVADLLVGEPGVEVARTGQPGSLDSVFLRGANNNQTLVLVDGIRVNNPFDDEFDFSQLAVDNIDRIEILRGPQSTLYGSEAAGGVINIVTTRASGPLSGSVSSEYGSFNTFLEQGAISASKGKFSVAADGSYASSDNDRINSDYEQYHFDANTRYEFSDRFSATLLTTYFHNNDGTPGDIYTDDPTARLRTENYLVGLTLDGTLTSWWDTKLTLSHSRENDNYDQPANAENYFTDDFSQTVARRDQVDLQNVFTLGEQNKILVGGTFEDASASLGDNGTYGPTTLAATIDTGSAYAQYDYTPVDRVTLTAGGRMDDSSSFGTHETYRLGGRFTAPVTETIFRASVGSGFRAPSIDDLYYPLYGNPNLKPEESTGFDAGLEQPLLQDKLHLGATFFYNHFDDLIQYSGLLPENVGHAQTYGVESFAAWSVLTNLTVRASYTWLDAEDLDTDTELIRRPEHSGNLDVNWRIIPQLDADLSVRYAGSRLDEDFDVYPTQNVTLGAYTKVDLALRWQVQKHVEIFARAENLLNQGYEDVYGYPALGRGFYGGVRLQF